MTALSSFPPMNCPGNDYECSDFIVFMVWLKVFIGFMGSSNTHNIKSLVVQF